MKKKITFFAAFFCVVFSAQSFANDIYAITVYHFTDASQEITLDTYLQTAYLPALHRKEIKNVGVFKPIANDTAADKIIYVIVPYKSFDEFLRLPAQLITDNLYKTAAASYLNADYKNPPYKRMETIMLTAFPMAPQLTLPNLTSPKAEHIYELRSYESPTENYHKSKVKMFNEGGEVDIFKAINANAIFYGDVVSGSHMPNLMYLTSYENMADRDAHWKIFGDNAQWKKLNTLDEYKNNVSKAEVTLMHAASYSDY
ncbi:NIPSNAP family protein [Parafilimonas sp.]|uniref:NIPSNAP family protein n=1 Tax=Parafilimonas sp. TaxID=1969739 RepID=UPI0039E5EDDA